jgi:hypothetical protein
MRVTSRSSGFLSNNFRSGQDRPPADGILQFAAKSSQSLVPVHDPFHSNLQIVLTLDATHLRSHGSKALASSLG